MPSDIDASQIGHLERPHGKAEFEQCIIDFPVIGAFHDHLIGLFLTRAEHPVADKARADTRDRRDLADLLRQLHRRHQHVVSCLFPAHDFQQFHYIGRREKMQTQNIFGPLGHRCNLVDIQIAGVAGEDCALFDDAIKLSEYFLFDIHILEHRLDHQIAIGEIVIGQAGGQYAHRIFDLLFCHAAALGGVFIIFADHTDSAVQRFFFQLDYGHGNAGGQEVHTDATSHRSGAQYADFLDWDQINFGINAVNLVGCPLGKEIMLHGSRLGAGHQFHEQFALFFHAIGIG